MKQQHKNYAFIDSQNLNLGVSRDVVNRQGRHIYHGQKLDYKKFRNYLREKYGVSRAYLFIGYMPSNTELYTSLQNAGYTLVFKTISSYTEDDGTEVVKGNVDTDIVLYAAAILVNDYELAVFVSGDGDFLSLYNYIDSQHKLLTILVPNRHRYSKLLNVYRTKLRFVSDLTPIFRQIKKTRSGDRSATLGLPSHGDIQNVSHHKLNVNAQNTQETEVVGATNKYSRPAQKKDKK